MGVRSSYGTTGMAPVLAAGRRHSARLDLGAACGQLPAGPALRGPPGDRHRHPPGGRALGRWSTAGRAGPPRLRRTAGAGPGLTTPAAGPRCAATWVSPAAAPGHGRTCRVRGLVDHAARLARLPGRDREVLAAAILDRLALTPWADVPLRAAPAVIARRARLAAAAVHQPELLLLDGLLDGLGPRDVARWPTHPRPGPGHRDRRDRQRPAHAGPGLRRGADAGRRDPGPPVTQPVPVSRSRLRQRGLEPAGVRAPGHVSYAPDEPAVRGAAERQTAAGEAWQCLRCGTFVAGSADGGRPGRGGPAGAPGRRAAQRAHPADLRGGAVPARARRSRFIAFGVWRFKYSRSSIEQAFDRELPGIQAICCTGSGYNIDGSEAWSA